MNNYIYYCNFEYNILYCNARHVLRWRFVRRWDMSRVEKRDDEIGEVERGQRPRRGPLFSEIVFSTTQISGTWIARACARAYTRPSRLTAPSTFAWSFPHSPLVGHEEWQRRRKRRTGRRYEKTAAGILFRFFSGPAPCGTTIKPYHTIGVKDLFGRRRWIRFRPLRL